MKLKNPSEANAVMVEARRVFPSFPGVVGFSAGPVTYPPDSEYDICLLIDLQNEDMIESYRLSQGHRAFVDDFLRPKLEKMNIFNVEL
jgi:hypothetical protein